MSPVAQLAAIATLALAALGMALPAAAAFAVTVALTLYGFRVPTVPESEVAPPPDDTPEEALRRDG